MRKRLLEVVSETLEEGRTRELRKLQNEIGQAIMNARLDLSATDAVGASYFKWGHKQARHNAAEAVAEIFSRLFSGEL